MRDRTVCAGVAKSILLRMIKSLALLFWLFLTAPGVALRALNYRRYRTAVTSGKAVHLYHALRGRSFDILHCHFGPNGLSGAFLKECGIARALVVTFHGSDINTYPSRHGTDVYRAMFPIADRITCNTQFTASKVVAHGAVENGITVIPVGFDTRAFPLRSYTPRRDRFVLLTVGRLVEKKGHRFVLEAIVEVRRRVSGLVYRVLGDGPLRGELEAQAARLGIDDICEFLGARTGDDLLEEYRNCDLFVLASATAPSGDMEGQGLVLQEAQAVGIPVLTTQHNGIPDGVLDGESGVLVPEADSTALAEAIVDLAADPERRIRMGEVGARFVRGRYDNSHITSRFNALYDAIVD